MNLSVTFPVDPVNPVHEEDDYEHFSLLLATFVAIVHVAHIHSSKHNIYSIESERKLERFSGILLVQVLLNFFKRKAVCQE